METIMNSVEKLALIMEEELALLENLLVFARDKEPLVAGDNGAALGSLLEQEEETVLVLREREAERTEQATRLAAALGLTDAAPTLRNLSERIQDPWGRRRLARAGRALEQAMGALSRQNTKISGLVKHRLRFTNFMLDVLYNARNGTQLYNMQGSRQEQAGSFSRLDYHA